MVAHVSAQVKQVRELDLRDQVQRGIWSAIEDILHTRGMPDRLANVLWEAYYRSLTDISPATAANDLATSVSVGFLQAQGNGRSRHYIAGDLLMPEIGRALDIDIEGRDEHARAAITGTLGKRIAADGLRAELRARSLSDVS